MNMPLTFPIGVALLGVAGAAYSLPARSDFGMGVNISNFGVGVEGRQKLSQSFDLRFGVSGIRYTFGFKYDDVEYDVEQSLAVPEIKLDWRPMQGIFRMTAGLGYYSDVSSLTWVPAPGDTRTIGNTTYTSAQINSLHGKLSYHVGSPYLGVGWDFLPNNKHLDVSLDLGAYYRGEPDVQLNSTGTVTASDLALEANNIKSDAWTFIPALRIGVLFRF